MSTYLKTEANTACIVAEHFWYICLLGSLVSVTDSS